jgi:hypothetical protein
MSYFALILGTPPDLARSRPAGCAWDCGFRRSGVTEYRGDQSGLIPANFITLAYF